MNMRDLNAPWPTSAASGAHTAAPAATVPATAIPAQTSAQAGDALTLLAGLARLGAAASALADALGVSPDRLARAEALDRLELDTALSVEALSAIPAATVARWFAVLGDDLRLDLRLPASGEQESGAVCALRAGRAPEAAFASFVASASVAAETASDDQPIELRVALAKSRALMLVRDLLAAGSGHATPLSSQTSATRVATFYTSGAWIRLVSCLALADWQRLGIVTGDARTLVVLCDSSGYLAGPALEVLGARQTEEPRRLTVSPAAWRRFRDRAREVRELRDAEGSWPDAPPILTPAHLRVEARSPGLEASAARLAEMRNALAAAYLASAVHRTLDGALLLRFAGARPATCAITGPAATQPTSATSTVGAAELGALAQLTTWAYALSSPDKLAIARECLARELPPGREVSAADLDAAAGSALEAARANFVLYLRGNTEQYFRLRQQALDAVTAYAASVRKSVGDLTSGVVDNVYRTVGLLAGVVIAALIQPSLSPLVTRIAAALYTLYMVFVLTYLLSARERRFQLETAGLDARLAAMAELSVSERAHMSSQAAPERAYFERYFTLSRALYIVLAALGLLIFLLLLWTPLGARLASR